MRHSAKRLPTDFIVGNKTINKAPEKMTVGELFQTYLSTFPFDDSNKWRRRKTILAKNRFSYLATKLVNKLQYRDLDKVLKDNNVVIGFRKQLGQSLTNAMRFVCDNQTASFAKGKGRRQLPPTSTNGNTVDLAIEPIQMSLEDALRKLKHDRSLYGEYLDNILFDLNNLPKGTPYCFEPKGKVTPKELKGFAHAIATGIPKTFKLRHLKKDNTFIIFHKSDLPNSKENKK